MGRQLNILLITQEDFLAGSTYSVFFLARGLAERGHRIYVAARENSLLHTLCNEANINFLPIELKSRFDWHAVNQLKNWVDQFAIDVINAQSSKDRYISVFCRWIYRLPVKIVHTRRQISLSVGGFIQNLVYVKGTDKIVAVGSGVKKSLEQKGVPSHHIKVIFNGTPPEKYDALNLDFVSSLKVKFNIKEGDLVVGCISRRKLQHQLLAALDRVDRPVKVILVGIREDEQLRSIINQFKLPHQVYFEGDVPSHLALNYIKLFHIYVLCSVTEGLSQSLLEAMFIGVPVVATHASGNDDLIEDGVNGFLFENDNLEELAFRIKTLSENPSLGKALARSARQRVVSQFTVEETVKNYEQFFYELKGLPHKSIPSQRRRALPRPSKALTPSGVGQPH